MKLRTAIKLITKDWATRFLRWAGIFETKVRWYDDVQRHEARAIPVRVWKVFGVRVWSRVEKELVK